MTWGWLKAVGRFIWKWGPKVAEVAVAAKKAKDGKP